MRKTTIVLLAVSAASVGGCSSSGTFANKPAPPQPENVTVYISDSKVSVSPTSIGAGPANFIVTNQASKSESVAILPAGADAGQSLADTGPINPQGTAQVAVNFTSKGTFELSVTGDGSSQAAQAESTSVQPVTIHVGAPRSGGSTQLLTP